MPKSNPLLSMFCCAGLVFCLCSATVRADVADDAYQLRMKGRVDEARQLLEDSLKKTPSNAAAHYELARTQMHMALGDIQNVQQHFEAAQKSIDQAAAQDADHVMYQKFAGNVAHMRGYYALKFGKPDVQQHFANAAKAYQAALRIKPDYPQVALALIELHTQFPTSAGADRARAQQLAQQLATTNEVYAAKARSVVHPESCGVPFWEQLLARKPNDLDVLEELGRAHLRQDDVDQAVKCFEKAIQQEPQRSYLFLDLTIYHSFRGLAAREDPNQLQQALTDGDAAITRYLKSQPSQPMEAYALGVRSKYKSFAGDKKKAGQLLARAEALDPYFSKATGAPNPDNFIPPTEISHNHRYFTRPF